MTATSTPKRLPPVLLLCTALFCINAGRINAQPVITGVNPLHGSTGTTVTITGSGFGTLDKSIVRFGDVKANIVSMSATQITVTVPPSSTYSHIEYTQLGGYTTFSSSFFCPTFNNLGVFTLTDNSFLAKTTIRIGGNKSPSAICAPDLDGDGRPDIAVANLNGGNISVYRNVSGEGSDSSFAAKQNYLAGNHPADIAYADFDHNGKLDLVVANYFANTLMLYKNESTPGNIVLTLAATLHTDNGPQQIAIADFNRDGKPDIAVSNYLSGTISVFRHGGGPFVFASKVTLHPAAGVYGLAAGDLDNDGKVDLVTANTQSNNASVFKNNCAGATIAFERKADVPTGAWPQSVAIGDFNQDGWADIVTANSFGHNISILKNLKALTFGQRMDKDATSFAINVYTSDVNGDGRVDIIVAGGQEGFAYIFRNNTTAGDFAFEGKRGYGAGAYTGSLAITDLDGDGKPDIATADQNGDAFSILKNHIGGPIITSFTPGQAATAGRVTITGAGFTNVTGVYFGGTRASSFLVNAQNSITATPLVGSSGNITVATTHGSDWLPGFKYLSYCEPRTNPNGYFLGQITVNHTIYSAPTLQSPGYKSYFDQVMNLFAEGNAVTVSVDKHATYNAKMDVAVFIDYNRNGVFDDAGERIYASLNQPWQATHSFSFNLPVTIQPGLAVIRVRAANANDGGSPCSNAVAGGTKDYLVNIPQIPAPHITSFSPASAGLGDTVIITGKHFTDAVEVSFGGVKANSYTVVSSTKIMAVVGVAATGAVSVSTPVGGIGQLNGFTYKPVTITGFTPAAAGQGDTVVITGDYLLTTSQVMFGGIKAHSFKVNSAHQVTAVVGTGGSGAVSLSSTVANATQLNGFTYKPVAITGFLPASAGPGDTVVITGDYVSATSQVLFGGAKAHSFTVNSAHQVTAVVGAGSSGAVSLISTAANVQLNGFTYKPVTITGFSPASAGQGDTIVITGDYLSATSHVMFGDVKAHSFKVNSAHQVTAIVDTGSTGTVSLTSAIGNTAQVNGFTFVRHVLKITSFSPKRAGPGQQVIITGANFKQVKSVLFGGTPARDYKVVSPNQITAILGNGGSGVVSVQSHIKMEDSAAGFTYLNYCIPMYAYSIVSTVKDITIDTVKFGVPHQKFQFNSKPVPLQRGRTNTITMTPVYPGSNVYTLVVWIDWNQDGSFSGENMGGVNLIAIEDKATGKYIFRFPIPANALPGPTRVRMRFDAFTTGADEACFSPTYGQVLDYTVVIPEKTGRGIASAIADDESTAATLQATVTPNPTKTNFKINVAGDAANTVELRVTDASGKILYHDKGPANHEYVFGGNFAAGIYFAQVVQGTKVKTIKLVKVQ